MKIISIVLMLYLFVLSGCKSNDPKPNPGADPHSYLPSMGCKPLGQSKVLSNEVSVTASWRNLCDSPRRSGESAYNPPPGWAILSTNNQVLSDNNGSFTVSTLAAGLDLITEEQLKQAYDTGIEAAIKAEDIAAEAKLKQMYSEHISELRKYKTNKNTVVLKAWAEPHGSCVDRKRGWIRVRTYSHLYCLGTSKSGKDKSIGDDWNTPIGLPDNF